MLHRWNSLIEDLNLFIKLAKRHIKKVCSKLKNKRGRPTKHAIEDYMLLLIAKEEDKKSLRGAEARLSRLICDERVDHSVISYWENKRGVTEILNLVVKELGINLQNKLGYEFSMVDSTKFSNWYNEEVEFHIVNRIKKGVVYPIGTSLITKTVAGPVEEAAPNGKGNLYGDAWYDDNKTIGILFGKGYIPIICPNKNRWHGYYRKKARKLYRSIKNRLGYRQRGRGESIFGSLTNEYGDRIKTLTKIATQTRSIARVIVHQVKLIIRIVEKLLGIVRHAQKIVNFIYPTSLIK